MELGEAHLADGAAICLWQAHNEGAYEKDQHGHTPYTIAMGSVFQSLLARDYYGFVDIGVWVAKRRSHVDVQREGVVSFAALGSLNGPSS